jgi:hypothetical protein
MSHLSAASPSALGALAAKWLKITFVMWHALESSNRNAT